MRRLLTILLPLLLPTLLYFGYLWFARSRGATGSGGTQSVRDIPWFWLGIAGLLLLAVTLVASTLIGGAAPGSHYQPPQLIDGQVQPGGFSDGS